MPTFIMQPYKDLKNKTLALLADVSNKHAENKTELNKTRNAQVELLASIVRRMKYMGRTTPFNATDATSKDYQKALSDRASRLGQEIHEMKAIVEPTESQKELLTKLLAEKEKNVKERKAMLKFRKTLMGSSKEDQIDLISEEQRSLALIGALLTVKKEIDAEYSGVVNKIISMVKENSPKNSVLYSGIDGVVGITAENQMDAETEKKALVAYRKLVTDIENVKSFDRSKLKKTETVVKDHLYIYELGARDDLFETKDQKQMYRRYLDTAKATEAVKPLIESFDLNKLNHVEPSVKMGQPSLVSEPGFAKLPDGQDARNKKILDNTDANVYLAGGILPADKDGNVIKLDAKQQQDAYAQSNKFFGGVKDKLEGKVALKHVTPETKPVDQNTVKYQRRF